MLRRAFCYLALLFLMFSLFLLPANATKAQSPLDNDGSNWSGWGHDLLNSRFNPITDGVNARNISKLKLKWAFVFPDATAASSQPAIVGNNLYVGGWNAKFYALNATTGHQKWSFDTSTVTGQLPIGTNAVRDGAVVANGKVYFGDYIGNFYALDATNGTLAWTTHLDSHPTTRITSSPIYYNGRIYVGVASGEELAAVQPSYPCCTFRGSLVALDAKTGSIVWRYYTVDHPAAQTGVSPTGTPEYGPSGAGVWASPAIDPIHNLLYFDTGNNYSDPATDKSDAIIALDLTNGQEKWHNQLTPNDSWNVSCVIGKVNCPIDNNVDDYDFGSSPNIFFAFINGQLRELVGAGQKSGIYHALDALTGKIVWQTDLVPNYPPTSIGGQGGIQWGASWDGERLYIATNQANPGTMYALDPATGKVLWGTPNPANGCTTGGAANYQTQCVLAMPSAVTSIPGVVFEGGWDGKFRAFDSKSGTILWQYDTIQSYTGTNGITGTGGSINGNGAVVANGMIYLNSGYDPYIQGGIGGNVLLAFNI